MTLTQQQQENRGTFAGAKLRDEELFEIGQFIDKITSSTWKAAEEETLRRAKEKIDGMVRDITAVSVAPAAKSAVRRIIEAALEELSERKVR